MSDILDFIKVFTSPSTTNLFTECACYWFAVILRDRFSGTIVYDPHRVHFATEINGSLYDITGHIKDTLDYINWEDYASTAEDADLIIQYCIKLERR